MTNETTFTMKPIGYVYTDAADIPRHWSISDVEGRIVINPEYEAGLCNIEAGQRIVVLFCFHESPAFQDHLLRQTPPHRDIPLGVFSICSPRRPNPIGLSVVEVLAVNGGEIHVKGIDMLDQTPVLDLKPHIEDRHNCHSTDG
ncbi:MAG: tRNA (N6-threonylcarbamoyladenosine(37)-N6)-methyltransferase TrmO [Thermodesulfobacteriota bacterium]|nr:tRNA (N6-threonylcarbamoyladenosine(37)-N6)-methyltransferase TrmO [Thermodesulfobacteriota bacterium]